MIKNDEYALISAEDIDGIKKYDSKKTIGLSAWLSPDSKDVLWQWYKESGLNEVTIFPACKENKEYLDYALAKSKELGLDVQVLLRNSTSQFGSDWKTLLNGYEDIITSFDIFDEPIANKEFSSLQRPDFNDLQTNIIPYVQQNFGKTYMSTLWPNYANADQLAVGTSKGYEDYIEQYCTDVLAKTPLGYERWLGVDFYPYYTTKFDGKLLNNLEIISHYAKEYDADTFLYIQTCAGHSCNWKAPNKNEISLQYYLALAYGAKRLSMYCYQEPAGGQSTQIPVLGRDYSMLTDGYSKRTDNQGNVYRADYERTHIYYSVQSLNNEMKELSKAYMDFSWQGVLTKLGSKNSTRNDFAGLSYTLNSYDNISIVDATENTIIGCFKDNENNNGYLVTNYSDPFNLQKSYLEIDFGSNMTRATVYIEGKCKVVKLNNGHLKFALNGGQGIFIIPSL